jgi:hypothetical protein
MRAAGLVKHLKFESVWLIYFSGGLLFNYKKQGMAK